MQAASRASYGLSILVFSLLAAVLVSCSTPMLDSVTSVHITEGNQVLLPGDRVTLSASVETQGSAVDTVTWASSAPTTAEIDQDGLLTVLAPGRADITATSDFDPGKHDSVEVTVPDPAEPLWIRQFGTDLSEDASAVATDDDGNILVAGDTEGDLEGPSHGGVDAFVRKLDSNGSELWSHQFGTPLDDFVAGVTTDIDDNIVVIGLTEGLLGDVAYGTTDAFVLKVDSGGTLLWTHQIGTPGPDVGSAVATDASRHIIVVGHTYGGLDGDSAGLVNGFVRKLDGAGNEQWTRQFGTAGLDYANGVAIGPSDRIIVAGRTFGDLEGTNAGGYDAVVLLYLPSRLNHLGSSRSAARLFRICAVRCCFR